MRKKEELLQTKRREKDIQRLLASKYEISPIADNNYDFYVRFTGPAGSPYEGGEWKVHVYLPEQYPYKSPSIGFINKIYHPNVDENSGSVCLDVINQTWSPMFELINIFEVFLPQLLLYPNDADPLNNNAASLRMKDIKKFEIMVQDYVKKYASDPILLRPKKEKEEDVEDEEEDDALSELSETSLLNDDEEEEEEAEEVH